MVVLLRIWEKTPAQQSAVFNDERISENTKWEPRQVRLIREHCSSIGWLRYSYEGSKDYTLTPAGLELARGIRRKQSLSRPYTA